jgi:hypothetical protein
MNKKELKMLIKPLVKECINEVLIEEGLLSNVVAEVAKGLQSAVITESQVRHTPAAPPEDNSQRLQEQRRPQRKKLMDAIGKDSYNGVNLFEDTDPASSYESREAAPGAIDLGDPRDAGVDISSLVSGASDMWKALK